MCTKANFNQCLVEFVQPCLASLQLYIYLLIKTSTSASLSVIDIEPAKNSAEDEEKVTRLGVKERRRARKERRITGVLQALPGEVTGNVITL